MPDVRKKRWWKSGCDERNHEKTRKKLSSTPHHHALRSKWPTVTVPTPFTPQAEGAWQLVSAESSTDADLHVMARDRIEPHQFRKQPTRDLVNEISRRFRCDNQTGFG
jgi:hypothetical protein